MTTKNSDSPEKPEAMRPEPKHGGHFVEWMFSGIGHATELPPARAPRPPEEPYRPLRESKAGRGVTYRLQSRTSELRV